MFSHSFLRKWPPCVKTAGTGACARRHRLRRFGRPPDMTRCVLALDQGTTSSRAILFDKRGRIVASAQEEFRQHFPQPGWVEHDPGDLWETTRRVALAVLRKGARAGATWRPSGSRTSARPPFSGTGAPVVRFTARLSGRIDARPAPAPRSKSRGLGPLFRKSTGLLLDPYFSGTKLAWLLDHIPGARRARLARRARVWNRGHLAPLEADGRPRARHGCLECLPHASRRIADGGLGGPSPRRAADPARGAFPGSARAAGFSGRSRGIAALRGVPVAGMAGDQRGGAVRAGLL